MKRNLRYNNFIILGISLIIIGVSLLLVFFEIISTDFAEIISYVFIFYGIISAYFSFNTGYRGRLFFSSAIFLSGVLLFVINNFEIFDKSSLIFTAILFIIGASFIILFIDNTNERLFLYSGMALLILSYSSAVFYNNLQIIKTANSLAELLMEYWPVLLLLFGINILLNRKR